MILKESGEMVKLWIYLQSKRLILNNRALAVFEQVSCREVYILVSFRMEATNKGIAFRFSLHKKNPCVITNDGNHTGFFFCRILESMVLRCLNNSFW